MKCRQCGCDNSEAFDSCMRCGTWLSSRPVAIAASGRFPAIPELPLSSGVLDPELVTSGYATMGERFLAFLCDISVGVMLVGAFLAAFYTRFEMNFGELKDLALSIIPVTYMVFSESLFHCTLGKRLLRLQVLADSAEPDYPTFFQVLVRETLGKFLCSLPLGIGFLRGSWNARRKTWADSIANTVVVKIGEVSGPRKALLVPILLIASGAINYALNSVPTEYRRKIDGQLAKLEDQVDELHLRILQPLCLSEPRSQEEYRERLKNMPTLLDQYSRLLASEQELISRSRKLASGSDSLIDERIRIDQEVTDLRREIAQQVREHLQLLSGFNSQTRTWDDVLRDRARMIEAVRERNNRINQTGRFYVRKQINF